MTSINKQDNNIKKNSIIKTLDFEHLTKNIMYNSPIFYHNQFHKEF